MMQNPKGKKPKKNKCGTYRTKNALSNLIICADCGSYYRRAIWKKRAGTKQSVWRCINRLDNGVNMCSYSPTIKEELLFKEIHFSIMFISGRNSNLYRRNHCIR